jgi:hypothetical protein
VLSLADWKGAVPVMERNLRNVANLEQADVRELEIVGNTLTCDVLPESLAPTFDTKSETCLVHWKFGANDPGFAL